MGRIVANTPLTLPVYVSTDLRYLSLSQTPADTARPRIRASVSRDVPVYSSFRWVLKTPYSRRNGSGWVDLGACLVLRRGGLPVQRRSHVHPDTNWGWRRADKLVETNMLPSSQTGNQKLPLCVFSPIFCWCVTIRYDTIRYDSGYLTCSKKLTGSQLSLPYGTNKKLECETKNKTMSIIGPVQSRYREAVQ